MSFIFLPFLGDVVFLLRIVGKRPRVPRLTVQRFVGLRIGARWPSEPDFVKAEL
jgi:hypothetical protein